MESIVDIRVKYPILACLFFALLSWKAITMAKNKRQKEIASKLPIQNEDPYLAIEPLHDFDWKSTEPLKIRPFKPKYHLTMALETCTFSDLTVIDNTYLERIQLRRKLIEEEDDAVVDALPRIAPAVAELYEWVFGTYLPKRFPSMFRVVGGEFENMVTNERVPVKAPEDAVEALKELGRHVDNEFLLMLPSEEVKDEGMYKLLGYTTCFPSGFDTREKLNKTLAAIHAPVPGYELKIQKSMNRFFASLPPGKIVKRQNWSITTGTPLFTLEGNHLYAQTEEEKRQEVKRQQEAVRPEKAHLRIERQTLHRLPGTGALVFGFKTYRYGLDEVKREGSGGELAAAVDGLKEASVPEMNTYKRGVVWGEKVKAYLRAPL